MCVYICVHTCTGYSCDFMIPSSFASTLPPYSKDCLWSRDVDLQHRKSELSVACSVLTSHCDRQNLTQLMFPMVSATPT